MFLAHPYAADVILCFSSVTYILKTVPQPEALSLSETLFFSKAVSLSEALLCSGTPLPLKLV